MEDGDPTKMFQAALRKPETGVPKKLEEFASIANNPEELLQQAQIIKEYAASPEKLWPSLADC